MPLCDRTIFIRLAVGVDADAVTVNVARTSDPRAYPKGETRVPRASLRTLQLQTKGRKFRLIGRFFGANAGIAGGLQAAIRIQGGVLSNKHPAAAADTCPAACRSAAPPTKTNQGEPSNAQKV